MASLNFPDSKFLIDRAERCRSLASTFLDPILRERMLELAGSYEEMAKASEKPQPIQSIRVGRFDD